MLPGFIETLMGMAERYPGPGIVSSALSVVADKDDPDWFMSGDRPPTLHPKSDFFSLKDCRSGYHSPEDVRRYHDTDAGIF